MHGSNPKSCSTLPGADPYQQDQLGGLALTMEGLRARDALVFEVAKSHGTPVAVVLAGGYARNVEDTVTIHCNTAKAARDALSLGLRIVPHAMPLAQGTKLGPYEITAPLGAGGMGEVYRARDTRLNRTVAIKVVLQHLSTGAVRERFEREGRAVASLNHPNICTLHDIGHEDGIDYLVMECLEGETLAERLQKGPLPLDQILRYAVQIADALDRAHRQGVVHRDLKPANVMLTKDGVKVLDFGLAKFDAENASPGDETSPWHSPGPA